MATEHSEAMRDISGTLIELDIGESESWSFDYVPDGRQVTITVENVQEAPKTLQNLSLFGFGWPRRQADITASVKGGGSHTETLLLSDVSIENYHAVHRVMDAQAQEDGLVERPPTFWEEIRDAVALSLPFKS